MSDTDKLSELMINDKGFGFDPETGFTYQISSVGTDVIQWLKDGLSAKEVHEKIVAEYDVDSATALRDLDAFMSSLERQELMSGDAGAHV